EDEFPSLRVLEVRNHTPIRYLLSGGLTLRQLVPSFMYPVVKGMEFVLTGLNNVLGMFETIVLEKTE
ncbi:MAG: class I SAM-dependent methyltransferase, partial [Planctomycetota bacterium]